MKGVYALVLRISQTLKVSVGSLGEVILQNGSWVYIGSAMGEGSTSLQNRLQRHFSLEKKLFWHIDWIIDSGAKPVNAIWSESSENIECHITAALIKSPLFELGPKGFGASDCQSSCGTHLFQYIGKMPVVDLLQGLFLQLGLDPQIW